MKKKKISYGRTGLGSHGLPCGMGKKNRSHIWSPWEQLAPMMFTKVCVICNLRKYSSRIQSEART